jgi:hypothetical protein
VGGCVCVCVCVCGGVACQWGGGVGRVREPSFHQLVSVSINFHQFSSNSISSNQFPSISMSFNIRVSISCHQFPLIQLWVLSLGIINLGKSPHLPAYHSLLNNPRARNPAMDLKNILMPKQHSRLGYITGIEGYHHRIEGYNHRIEGYNHQIKSCKCFHPLFNDSSIHPATKETVPALATKIPGPV